MNKHTPGPWKADSPDDGCVAVIAADGELVAHATGGNQATDIANAALIAAAPDLLEACRASLELDAVNNLTGKTPKVLRELHDQCRAAIAKATGATPC